MENPFLVYAVVTEIAGERAVVKTENNIIASKLLNLGFNINEYGCLEKKNLNQDSRISNIEQLIDLDAIFSSGKDWSPEDLLSYYKELGLLNKSYKVIAWKDKDNYLIRVID